MKVVIVGGVAGGASAAARIRRLDESAEIIVFEKGNKDYCNDELFFGPKLLKDKNDVFLEKWTGIYEKLDKIVVFHDEEDKKEMLKGIKRAICK